MKQGPNELVKNIGMLLIALGRKNDCISEEGELRNTLIA